MQITRVWLRLVENEAERSAVWLETGVLLSEEWLVMANELSGEGVAWGVFRADELLLLLMLLSREGFEIEWW